MEASPHPGATRYLRMFSYLLILCGAVSIAVGMAVAWTAVVQTTASLAAAPIGSLALAMATLIAGGLTVAVGILGRVASGRPDRLEAFRTVALVDITATVLGLGLCYALNASLPTSLLFNGLLMVVCIVISNNLRKTQN